VGGGWWWVGGGGGGGGLGTGGKLQFQTQSKTFNGERKGASRGAAGRVAYGVKGYESDQTWGLQKGGLGWGRGGCARGGGGWRAQGGPGGGGGASGGSLEGGEGGVGKTGLSPLSPGVNVSNWGLGSNRGSVGVVGRVRVGRWILSRRLSKAQSLVGSCSSPGGRLSLNTFRITLPRSCKETLPKSSLLKSRATILGVLEEPPSGDSKVR